MAVSLTSSLKIDFDVDIYLTASLTSLYDVNLTTVVGTVRNTAGQPVPYGRVFLYRAWGPVQVIESDENGWFSFTGEEGMEITMVIPDVMYDRKFYMPVLEPLETQIDFTKIEREDTRYLFPSIRFRP